MAAKPHEVSQAMNVGAEGLAVLVRPKHHCRGRVDDRRAISGHPLPRLVAQSQAGLVERPLEHHRPWQCAPGKLLPMTHDRLDAIGSRLEFGRANEDGQREAGIQKIANEIAPQQTGGARHQVVAHCLPHRSLLDRCDDRSACPKVAGVDNQVDWKRTKIIQRARSRSRKARRWTAGVNPLVHGIVG